MDDRQQQRRIRNDNERPMPHIGNQGGWGSSNDRQHGDTRQGSDNRQGRWANDLNRAPESRGFGADDDYSANETRDWEPASRDEGDQSRYSGYRGAGSSKRVGAYDRGQFGSQGEFAGRGPKGYQRSDERLKEDISERLLHDGQIDASDVSLEVKDGKVTLEGSVPSRQTKHNIEDLVDHVFGVKDIDNRLRVGQSSGTGQDPAQSAPSTGGASTGKPRKDRE